MRRIRDGSKALASGVTQRVRTTYGIVEPAKIGQLEADREAGQGFPSSGPHPSSFASPTLSRQASAVGAECLNRARLDRCGGRSKMNAPTAIPILKPPPKKSRRTAARSTSAALGGAWDRATAAPVHA